MLHRLMHDCIHRLKVFEHYSAPHVGGMKLFEPRLKLMLKNGTRVVSMWPRQFPDEDDEENQVLDATERIRYYDPGAGTFSDKKTHSFGLKIYIWEPISN
mmetsp:Transcript_33847/g.54485  ORF Transcript_33847/g.54485 Transcript_33847/m.54485 type:complete len:100 (+) Transcript_33847:681-980(+)